MNNDYDFSQFWAAYSALPIIEELIIAAAWIAILGFAAWAANSVGRFFGRGGGP